MLVDLKINEFVDVLSSDAPAPGGGSVAALAGAIGIALAEMVAALTTGKAKYQEHEALVQEILVEAAQLKPQFLAAVDRDTQAYNLVMSAYSLPRETAEDKALRSQAIQDATKEATLVPFELMQLSLQALTCASKAIGKTNTNAASDLGVCALQLKTALQGAWLNVLINLSGIKDEQFVAEYQKAGLVLYNNGTTLADAIYSEILNSLTI